MQLRVGIVGRQPRRARQGLDRLIDAPGLPGLGPLAVQPLGNRAVLGECPPDGELRQPGQEREREDRERTHHT